MTDEDEDLELGIEDSELSDITETSIRRQIYRMFGRLITDILPTQKEHLDGCDAKELARNYPRVPE